MIEEGMQAYWVHRNLLVALVCKEAGLAFRLPGSFRSAYGRGGRLIMKQIRSESPGQREVNT
jgi:hypothetical protein